MKQHLSTGVTGQLTQQQHLAHSLQRSLELLALPLPELEQRLMAEISDNPMLESEEFTIASDLPAADTDVSMETEDENDFESNSILPEEWRDDLPLPSAGKEDNGGNDYIGSLAAPPPPLRSELLTELYSSSLPEKMQNLAAEIICALNDDGFLAVNPADLAMQCDAEMSEIMEALHLVQQISPPGIAARDLPECLKLQLQRQGKLTAEFAALLDGGIADLEKNRMDHLMKKLDLAPDELESMLKTLRSLNPAPGRVYAPPVSAVIPDLVIAKDEKGNYIATVQRSNATRIVLSPWNEKLLDDDSLSADDRAYLTEKLTRAKELLKALDMRKSTLQQLGNLIVEQQKEFLDNGKAFLKPMTMKSAAAELQLSESTVSRCAAGKFAETPQGVFPLKFFFSTGVGADDGDSVSNRAVSEKIRQLIGNEDPFKPLSDEELAKLLKADGISVARRTVAKYRESLNIPSSSGRKKFF